MTVRSGESVGRERAPSDVPSDVAAADPAPASDGSPRRGSPCDCHPAAPDGWLACAHCGLPQAPGKEFCGFCGHRWVDAPAGRGGLSR